MRNQAPVVAHRPRYNQIAIAAPSHFYKFHEATGSSCADSLGKAGALTLAASGTGTPWSNSSWITPDGTNHYVQRTDDSVLNSIYRLDQAFGHIIFALDYWIGATPGTTEQLLHFGTDLGTGGFGGGWGVRVNTSRQFQISTRAISASARSDDTFTGYTTLPTSQRNSIVIEVVYLTASTVSANLYANGALKSTIASINLLANSGTAPYGSIQTANGSVQGYSVGVMPTGTSTRSNICNAGGTAATRYARWLGYRSSVRDSTLAAKVALEMWQYQGEFPRSLLNKTGSN